MERWRPRERVVAAYHTPCFVHKDGRLSIYHDDAAKRRYFGELLEGTRPELAAGSRWDRPDVWIEQLGSSSALATVRWVFERPSGETLEDYFDSYLFGLVSRRWGFLGDTVWDE